MHISNRQTIFHILGLFTSTLCWNVDWAGSCIGLVQAAMAAVSSCVQHCHVQRTLLHPSYLQPLAFKNLLPLQQHSLSLEFPHDIGILFITEL